MNKKVVFIILILLCFCFESEAQTKKKKRTKQGSENKIEAKSKSRNRQIADSLFMVHQALLRGDTIAPTINPTKKDVYLYDQEESKDEAILVENNDAPCKSLYNNTWCTNKVKMPSFEFGDFPDELNIMLIDLSKDQSFHFPLDKGRLSSSYGWRWNRPHRGVDYAIKRKENVYAVFDGVVRVAQRNGGYGKMVLIRHYNNLETLYAHLDKINVKVGDKVKAGDIIGLSGNTGVSTGPHLHFEVLCLYQAFDPEWIFDLKNRTLKTDRIKIEKHFFGVKGARKYKDKEIEISPLAKVDSTFKDKPYYSFKEKYASQKPVDYLAKDRNKNLDKPFVDTKDKSKWRYWRVKKGDTLSKIAKQFNISPSQLKEINGLKTDILKPNTRIRVR